MMKTIASCCSWLSIQTVVWSMVDGGEVDGVVGVRVGS